MPHVPQGRAPVRVLVTGATGLPREPAAAAARRSATRCVARRPPSGRGRRDRSSPTSPRRVRRCRTRSTRSCTSRSRAATASGPAAPPTSTRSTSRHVPAARARARAGARLRARVHRRRLRASREPAARGLPARPAGFYPRSKLAAEVLAAGYGTTRDAVLRPFFDLRPGQEGMLVATLAARVQAGEEVVVQGDPGLRLNPIHVDDAVRAGVRRGLEHDSGRRDQRGRARRSSQPDRPGRPAGRARRARRPGSATPRAASPTLVARHRRGCASGWASCPAVRSARASQACSPARRPRTVIP